MVDVMIRLIKLVHLVVFDGIINFNTSGTNQTLRPTQTPNKTHKHKAPNV
jgi:hypothetical protein